MSQCLSFPIHKFSQSLESRDDVIAVEEPLLIQLIQKKAANPINQTLTVTMRTPGADEDLAMGFLFAEGIIKSFEDLVSISLCGSNSLVSKNVVKVVLKQNVTIDLEPLTRMGVMTSSCGLCGKTSLDAVRAKLPKNSPGQEIFLKHQLVRSLPEALKRHQSYFNQTGGMHASALFDEEGKFLFLREDVGRHNALDKLIGHALRKGMLPLNRHILLVSGRISFELVQKALMAGIKIFLAIGAPSSLAIDLAREQGMTLIGFVKEQSFNVYCGEKRLL